MTEETHLNKKFLIRIHSYKEKEVSNRIQNNNNNNNNNDNNNNNNNNNNNKL